jgi:hypothetical protein
VNERIEVTRQLFWSGARKSEIKRDLRRRFGELSHSTIEQYLKTPRRELLTEVIEKLKQLGYIHRARAGGREQTSSKPSKDNRVQQRQQLSPLLQLVDNETKTLVERLRAAEQAYLLLGINWPLRRIKSLRRSESFAGATDAGNEKSGPIGDALAAEESEAEPMFAA